MPGKRPHKTILILIALIMASCGTTEPPTEEPAESAPQVEPTAESAETAPQVEPTAESAESAPQVEQPAESAETAPQVEPTAESAPQVADAGQLYTVTRIYDGDTIDAFKDGETTKVRLACIDAPESDQAPHGQASRQQLSNLLPGQVRLNIVDRDRYGRSIAEIYHPNDSFINLQMVQSGHAVVYDQYLDSCGANGASLLAAEEQAMASSRGVWADENFVMPWDHRRGITAPAAESTPDPVPSSDQVGELPACVQTDCNCGDLDSWEQAQAVLRSAPGDPHGLDGDGDGEACESLQ